MYCLTSYLDPLVVKSRSSSSDGVENARKITWDAISKFVGGAERAGCESLFVPSHVRSAK